ncbi:hypothetical protein [Pelagibius sp.]|uniref:hypothetical protein n=1 Tax=Pelagibius sp. TaxID=1931238 RepID=UPI0026283D07|nr:hypothetical protein [Pelagibius sp.]
MAQRRKSEDSKHHPIFHQAVEQFKGQEITVIEVEEWGIDGKPAIIHATPMNLDEKNRVNRYGSKEDLSALCEVLILKARDENGDPIFTRDLKPRMMRELDPDVIASVVKQIVGEEEDPDQAAGN